MKKSAKPPSEEATKLLLSLLTSEEAADEVRKRVDETLNYYLDEDDHFHESMRRWVAKYAREAVKDLIQNDPDRGADVILRSILSNY